MRRNLEAMGVRPPRFTENSLMRTPWQVICVKPSDRSGSV